MVFLLASKLSFSVHISPGKLASYYSPSEEDSGRMISMKTLTDIELLLLDRVIRA